MRSNSTLIDFLGRFSSIRLDPAQKDAAWIFSSAFAAWLVIERTETCDRFFKWVADNPESEVDSVILAFLLSAIGITFFAWRRYREIKLANIAREQARTLAYHDPLTGLSNRRALSERLEEIKANRKKAIALVSIDLDGFKAVNDIHGHLRGDRLLRIVAEVLATKCAAQHSVYRLGGDEFAIVVEIEGRDDPAPRNVARSVVSQMRQPFSDEGLVCYIGASAGIALFPSDAESEVDLLRAADVALYRAKAEGRNQFRFFESSMDDCSKRKARLEDEMRAGIKAGHFSPHYQPIIDMSSEEQVGFELLARWDRADGENIGPDEFITIAEESGLINELTLGLLDKACQEVREWDPALTFAVNISPVQLQDPQLAQKILAVLARHGFAPSRLVIEITENAIISDEANAKRTVESLKNQGIHISLDDFGAGYASLNHLRILPFDKIKIDKKFTKNLTRNPEALKLVEAILGLAIILKLPVVAEGIETAEDARVLKRLGCAHGQGFLFGRPAPAGSHVQSQKVEDSVDNLDEISDDLIPKLCSA